MKNEELKMILDAQFSAVRATVEAQTDILDKKIDGIIQHQKWQNSKLEKHDKAVMSFETYQDSCPANRAMKIVNKKAFWIGVAVLWIVTGFVGTWLFHNVDLISTIENKTGVEIID